MDYFLYLIQIKIELLEKKIKQTKTDKTDKTDKNPTKKFIPKPNIDDTTNDDYISAYKIHKQTNIKDNNFPKSGFLDTNEISQKNANVCEKIGCLKNTNDNLFLKKKLDQLTVNYGEPYRGCVGQITAVNYYNRAR